MRLALIDQQPLVREGLGCIFRQRPGFFLCGSAGNAREGLRMLEREQPDLVLLDLWLPGMSGTTAAREVRRRWPSMKLAFLSASCCERDVLEALDVGASGYFTKQDQIDSLIEGLSAVMRGERYLAPSTRSLALPSAASLARSDDQGPRVLAALSVRERQVFELAVRGFRNREIARELCIAPKTVGSHRLQINRKLGCSSASELVYFAATNGLLPAPAAAVAFPAVAAPA